MLENTQQSTKRQIISAGPVLLSSEKLLHFPRPNKQATVRLVYFPPAGVSAALYESWAALLPPSFELCIVQFPSQEQHASTAIARLSEALSRVSNSDQKLIFLGAYLGAFWAYEVAHHLRNNAWLQIDHLLIVAFPPPHLRYSATAFMRTPEFARIMADAFSLDSFTPQFIASLLQNALHEADLADQPGSSVEIPLHCPLTAFSSAYDRTVDLPSLQAWQSYISGTFRLHTYNGGHFYEQHYPNEFLQNVVERLFSPS